MVKQLILSITLTLLAQMSLAAGVGDWSDQEKVNLQESMFTTYQVATKCQAENWAFSGEDLNRISAQIKAWTEQLALKKLIREKIWTRTRILTEQLSQTKYSFDLALENVKKLWPNLLPVQVPLKNPF